MPSRFLHLAAATLALAAGGAASARTTLFQAFSNLRQTGALVLTTNNSQQQIEIVIGPVPGQVTVSGISTVPSGFVFDGVTSIDLTTGRSQDYVEFRVQTSIVPDIRVNTGAGNSDVKVIYQIQQEEATATSSVTVVGRTGNDKVAFVAESTPAGFVADWSVNHGAGTNEAIAVVNAEQATELLGLSLNASFGAGSDVVLIDAITGAAQANIALTGSMSGGNDTAIVKLDGTDAVSGGVVLALDMGAGNDESETDLISRGGSLAVAGSVQGGAGFDKAILKLEADGRVDAQFAGGDGADLIDLSLKGSVEGSPWLLGGAGDDELKLVVDGPRIASPFIDGGPGFDKAIGFGKIVNVEEIN